MQGELFPQHKIEKIGNSYLKDFGLTWKFLTDKKILDIGGADGSFTAAAKSHGVDATSIDLYPHFNFEKGVSDKIAYVGGDVYHLPFKDEAFDFACARHVTPGNTSTGQKENTRDYIKEVMRVIKHGGEFRILPITFLDDGKEVPLDLIKSFGFPVELEKGGSKQYYIFRKV